MWANCMTTWPCDHIKMKIDIANKISEFFVNYFTLTGQLVSQAEAEKNIREGVSFRGTNILILIIAIFIASLGLNTNSTAVIIGAMLISPLMGPIIGIGLGVGIHDFDLIKRCVRNLAMAAGFSVITATIYFFISPVSEQHSELLARTSPTIYDVLIGFFGGGAGIIALGANNKGNVIPGVAIATALMPPLCTAGYGIATWQLNYFFGAFYLFFINSVYIAFATFIGVKLMKYQAHTVGDNNRARRVRRIVYSLAILTMLPSIYLTYTMLRQNKFTMNADTFVADECRFPDTQVISHKAYTDHGERVLSMTLIGQPLPADSLQLALSSRLKFYGLAGTRLVIIQGVQAHRDAAQSQQTAAVGDIYRLAQGTISRQQGTIDSLKTIIAEERSSFTASSEVASEIKVVFPNIHRIGISTAVFNNIGEHEGTDTTTVAMVHTKGKLTKAERVKLAEYLEARLSVKSIEIVEVP